MSESLIILLSLTIVVLSWMYVQQNHQLNALLSLARTTIATETDTAPNTTPSSHKTNGYETIATRSLLSGSNRITFTHRCNGTIEPFTPVPGGAARDTELTSYCLGSNQLVATTATGTETIIQSSNSTSAENAPIFESATRVGNNILIEYGVFPCTYSEDSCGAGLPSNNNTYVYSTSTNTARALTQYPDHGQAIWNTSGTKALFPVVQVGGAGCDRHTIVGYNLTTDTASNVTTEEACPFQQGEAEDVSGNPEPEWGPIEWTSDTTFTALRMTTDGEWHTIQGTF